MRGRWRKRRGSNYDQNHGVPGVVYILENPGLREGWFKIGCSRRSGGIRATELNLDANTGTPGSFRCVFELRTKDCGKAEERVFQKLADHRRGKWGQEFFEVALDPAKEIIIQVCGDVDREVGERPQPQNSPISSILGDVSSSNVKAQIQHKVDISGGSVNVSKKEKAFNFSLHVPVGFITVFSFFGFLISGKELSIALMLSFVVAGAVLITVEAVEWTANKIAEWVD